MFFILSQNKFAFYAKLAITLLRSTFKQNGIFVAYFTYSRSLIQVKVLIFANITFKTLLCLSWVWYLHLKLALVLNYGLWYLYFIGNCLNFLKGKCITAFFQLKELCQLLLIQPTTCLGLFYFLLNTFYILKMFLTNNRYHIVDDFLLFLKLFLHSRHCFL